jgi:hypothetical protein
VKHVFIVISAMLLAGCQSMSSTSESSIWFRVKPGSKLVLNRALEIPSGQAHIKLQQGAVTGGVDEYTINCSFEVKNPGPQTINPDTFLIHNVSSQREWVSQPDTMDFYMVFRLQSTQQADVEKLFCGYWDGPLSGKPVTVEDVKQALGEYMTFEFAQ